ncbi:hypothetical protein Tsubulata_006103 [Turnera subulata]|uniref:CCHC-type domain-containing protein n=1 Tax=Turnera subulata TaxID=218843 RepID=A0A9Q0FXI3_9ROSI|nr:hypothetical protein Tsubulata_006103 [Turnera subulata]
MGYGGASGRYLWCHLNFLSVLCICSTMEREQLVGDGRLKSQLAGESSMVKVGESEEEEVFILEESESAQIEASLFCVLGKVLDLKHVNPQAFANITKKVWIPLKGIEVEQINRNLFLSKIFSKRDRQAIVEANKPLFFEKQLVVLKAISGGEVLTQVPLNEVLLWVQLLDIPLNQRTANNVSGIASKAGKFVSFDEKGAVGWGKFVRARVLVNTYKPLRKSLMIRKEGGPMITVSFRYEGKPNFCYICGKLGHVLEECECRNEDSNEEEKHNFGEWLRESPRKPYNVRLEAIREQAAGDLLGRLRKRE